MIRRHSLIGRILGLVEGWGTPSYEKADVDTTEPGRFHIVPDTANYIFLSYGSAGDPGIRQFEIKSTRDSNSQLYYSSNGIDQSETES